MLPMQATGQIDLIDPAGVVQSQSVRTADGELRITLSGTLDPGTLAVRYLQASFGAGFQHLAFATADIFAAADAMRRAGLEILQIPANYYEDLAARFALEDELVERLRANDILYDQDADDRVFLQFFTRAFDKRFFFEVVQRGGYQGYGAANAGVRLAAQARFVDGP